MVSWPTLLGRCTICGDFLAHPAGLVHHLQCLFFCLFVCFFGGFFFCLAHPARPVHHLPWFLLGPLCRASAPFAVIFTWPTLPGQCTTCHGYLANPAGWVHHLPQFFRLTLLGRLVNQLAVVFLTLAAGLVYHLLRLSGCPCQARAPLLLSWGPCY